MLNELNIIQNSTSIYLMKNSSSVQESLMEGVAVACKAEKKRALKIPMQFLMVYEAQSWFLGFSVLCCWLLISHVGQLLPSVVGDDSWPQGENLLRLRADKAGPEGLEQLQPACSISILEEITILNASLQRLPALA